MNMDDGFEAAIPHSIDAERSLLGALMLDEMFRAETVPTLDASSFFLRDHAIVFEVLRDLTEQRRPVDAIILRDEVKARGQFDEIGGSAYIAQILGSVPSAAHGPEYARRVREHAARRALIALAEGVIRRARSGEVDAAGLAGELAESAGAVMADRTAGGIVSFAEAVESAYDGLEAGGRKLIPTGLTALDARIGGLGAGETVILAARPSMGKSTLARTIARNVAGSGVPVGFISLEESPEKIARNVMSGEALIDNHKLRGGRIGENDWPKLADAMVRLSKLPIVISRQARTVSEIRAMAAAMRSKHGCRLIVVDHLSRVRAPGKSLYEQVTAASGALSDAVKDLGVAGLILCQLNRGVEHRDDPRPTMSDLRDSGAIEQDADGILLLHRADYYGAADPTYVPDGVAEIIVAKWRDGVRGGVARVQSDLRYQRFIDLPEPSMDEIYTRGGW